MRWGRRVSFKLLIFDSPRHELLLLYSLILSCSEGDLNRSLYQLSCLLSSPFRLSQASQSRRRRVINGKVVTIGGKAPKAAGQGADFLEGFQQGTRCFKWVQRTLACLLAVLLGYCLPCGWAGDRH